MASGNSPMRMGTISIFALVIIVCSAVLVVLSYSTAQATAALAQRQADSATALYTEETMAQQLSACVNEALDQARAQNLQGSALQNRLEKAILDYRVWYNDVQEGDDPFDVTIGRLDVVGPDEALELAGAADTGASVERAVYASFKASDNRTLDVVIGVTPEGSSQVLAWKTGVEWTESEEENDLWAGPGA